MDARLVALLLACAGAGACGEDSDRLSPGDDPGTGNGTLTVVALAQGHNYRPSTFDPNDFTVDFRVSVSRDGQAVTDAQVSVVSDFGSVALTYDPQSGDYLGSQAPYLRRYRLDVRAGGDRVSGVQVEAPDVHRIHEPAANGTVSVSAPFTVMWERDAPADQAALQTSVMPRTEVADDGEETLATGNITPTLQAAEYVNVYRANVVVPAGAAAGSSFTVELRNQVPFVTVP